MENKEELVLVESVDELLGNAETLYGYLNGTDEKEKQFAVDLIQNGMVFLAVKQDKTLCFYPSRFIGYKNNTMEKHLLLGSKKELDGKKTTPKISRVLGKTNEFTEEADNEFKLFCEKIGAKIYDKKRSYWLLETAQNILDKELKKIKKLFKSNEKIPTAVKKQIVKARIGQGKIRNRLFEERHCCELCGIGQKELLVASHIKPWADCEKSEQGDLNNLLLLCAMHDALFDKGFISFDEEGKILVSKVLSEKEYKKYLLDKTMKIKVTDGNREFLQYHREHIFKE